ncbi:unnamed protein product [Tetraodon nigroviridis]|uniref:Mitochondrial ribosome-associated GTPase 1 n=1 Tax=Tetraodon nigroviridis TaxID=99883 RepID=Q4RQE6_TETNG|nr:unnamed protein product [Tetraodon nigroviridis]
MAGADCRVLIVGCGISGVAAAQRLVKSGFKQVRILEATGRSGGRILTETLGADIIEVGAASIHGPSEENPLFCVARDYGLLAPEALTQENQSMDVDERPPLVSNWFSSAGQRLSSEDEAILDQVTDVRKNWIRKIFILCGWIAGHESEYMESLPEEEFKQSVTELIHQFTGNPAIMPKRIFRTRWFNNPWTCGSYSNPAVGWSLQDLSNLREPLPSKESQSQPLQVLFAGEATHTCYYSTVHGALLRTSVVEIGANWIHGPSEENPVFRLARQYGLLEEKALSLENQTIDVNGHPVLYPNVFTSSGWWLSEKKPVGDRLRDCGCAVTVAGRKLNVEDIVPAEELFTEIMEESSQFVTGGGEPFPSVGEFVRAQVQQRVEEKWKDIDEPAKSLLLCTISTLLKLESGINGAHSMDEVGLGAFGQYKSLPGLDCTFPGGYEGLIKNMMEGLPSGLVTYHQPVRCVHWNATEKKEKPVIIQCNNGEMIAADHVIVTIPLGFLKKHHSTLFSPPLPLNKIHSIQRLGFGTNNKIFVEFDSAWWDADCEIILPLWEDEVWPHVVRLDRWSGVRIHGDTLRTGGQGQRHTTCAQVHSLCKSCLPARLRIPATSPQSTEHSSVARERPIGSFLTTPPEIHLPHQRLKQMRASLKSVDCIIEIHDARISFPYIPLSGRNPVFQETLDVRPHLLILNKKDLADVSDKQNLLKTLAKKGVKNVLFTDCLKQRDESVQQLVPTVVEMIKSSPRFARSENTSYCLMVIGVPNVGKSSLINSLRRTYLKKGRASRVGGEPGITKAVLTKIQVCDRPIVHLLDTPGVLPPRIESVETGMKLALCGTILDHLVGEDVIADYLLYSLNRLGKFSYVEKYDLEQPSDDIQFVLKRIAVKLGKTQRVKAITGVGNVTVVVPNYTAAAYDFIRAFRKGELGQVVLD